MGLDWTPDGSRLDDSGGIFSPDGDSIALSTAARPGRIGILNLTTQARDLNNNPEGDFLAGAAWAMDRFLPDPRRDPPVRG